MSAIGFIFLGIFLWICYTLFVRVVWPIYKTTRQLKKQFRNMAEQREAQNEPPPSQNPNVSKKKVGEYIEFEEVK